MADMIMLRHKLTGIAGMYPEHFRDFDYFEVVLEEEPCTDCVVEFPKETPEETTEKKNDKKAVGGKNVK